MSLFTASLRVLIRFELVGALALFATLPAMAATEGPAALRERYSTLEPRFRASVFHAPLYIESEDRDRMPRGDIYGVLSHSFAVFSATLRQLPAWCDLVTLHFNVKGCNYRSGPGEMLRIYIGGKRYEDPQDAHPYEFTYAAQALTTDYLHVLITAADGPLDTYDYRLEIEAVPLGDRTFAHVRFTYHERLVTRLLSATYFSTLGRSKVGFSVVGTDPSGNPLYLKGRGGAMERNVMRYYLGLQALLEGLSQPEEERFEWRLRRWYALTDRYRRQLYELDEGEYLQAKRSERADQSRLQSDFATPR